MTGIELAHDYFRQPENYGSKDYKRDGIRYCGECHTPKECMVRLGPVTKKMNCLCKCEQERKNKIRQEQKELRLFEEKQALINECIQDPMMRRCTFEKDNGSAPKAILRAKQFVNNWDRFYADATGILFFGDVGTGKSYAAACIANALLEKRVSVLMTSFIRIINGMPDAWSGKRNGYIESFDRYKLLIIDDLGTERQSEYAIETVFSIIDQRYKSKQPLIVTTNITENYMKNIQDMSLKRIYDRIREMCLPVRIDGASIRTLERQKKMENYMDVFTDAIT